MLLKISKKLLHYIGKKKNSFRRQFWINIISCKQIPSTLINLDYKFIFIVQAIEAIETNTLPDLVERCTKQITGLVYLVQGDLDPGNRITVEALIVLDVHGKF